MINPTGYTALDLVGFTDKGTYASNVNYVKNDIVHYGGNLWRCKIDDTMNVTPAEGENWTVFVGEPTNLVERIIAPLEENPATVAYAAGRQIIYDDWLWEVVDDIAVGDPLIDYAADPTNANIKKAVPVETQLLDIKAKVGPLASLATTIKTSIVAAINEIVGKIGNLSSLGTTDKTSAVNAINEVNTKVSKTEVLATNAQQMIAPILSSLVAPSGGLASGDQFIYQGLLYKATAVIAQGGTITINGNCALADSVTGQIKTLSDDTGIVTLTTGIWYRKRGNEVIVNFTGNNTTNLNNAEWTLVGTLPTGYRPSTQIFSVITLSSSIDYYGVVSIDNNGQIRIFHRAGSTQSHIWGEIVFMI